MVQSGTAAIRHHPQVPTLYWEVVLSNPSVCILWFHGCVCYFPYRMGRSTYHSFYWCVWQGNPTGSRGEGLPIVAMGWLSGTCHLTLASLVLWGRMSIQAGGNKERETHSHIFIPDTQMSISWGIQVTHLPHPLPPHNNPAV